MVGCLLENIGGATIVIHSHGRFVACVLHCQSLGASQAMLNSQVKRATHPFFIGSPPQETSWVHYCAIDAIQPAGKGV
jgi:hypothetical protein